MLGNRINLSSSTVQMLKPIFQIMKQTETRRNHMNEAGSEAPVPILPDSIIRQEHKVDWVSLILNIFLSAFEFVHCA